MKHKNSPAVERVRDIRTLPFIWIHRSLLETVRPSWKGLMAYTALVFYASGQSGKCRDVGTKVLADRVGVSEDTMKRGLRELQSKKAIQVRPRYAQKKNGKQQQLPNEYVLLDLQPQTVAI